MFSIVSNLCVTVIFNSRYILLVIIAGGLVLARSILVKMKAPTPKERHGG